jgi:hypothetical protein
MYKVECVIIHFYNELVILSSADLQGLGKVHRH